MIREQIVTESLFGCARCGNDHIEEIVWEKLVNPVPDPTGDYTYWTQCPDNGQSVLMRKVVVDA